MLQISYFQLQWFQLVIDESESGHFSLYVCINNVYLAPWKLHEQDVWKSAGIQRVNPRGETERI